MLFLRIFHVLKMKNSSTFENFQRSVGALCLDHEHFSNLLNLLNEKVGELQVRLHAVLNYGVVEYVIVRAGQLDSREQV